MDGVRKGTNGIAEDRFLKIFLLTHPIIQEKYLLKN